MEMGKRKPTTHRESNYTVKQKAVVARSGNQVADRLVYACVPLCAWGGREAQGIVSAKKGGAPTLHPIFPSLPKTT